MATLFALPNELVISSICSRYPCRDQQIRSLLTLLSVRIASFPPLTEQTLIRYSTQIRAASSRNIVIHGLEATGKSAVTKTVLEALSSTTNSTSENEAPEELRYAIVRSVECIGGRHLLEQTVGTVAKALEWRGAVARCENISQLVVQLGRLLENWTADTEDPGRRRFAVVFDGIDKQRDAPPTLLPALARMSEVVSRGHRNPK